MMKANCLIFSFYHIYLNNGWDYKKKKRYNTTDKTKNTIYKLFKSSIRKREREKIKNDLNLTI